ncbi:hypothetical protein AVEN_203734-1 [Araneus ventricosus]|uniref:Uncharacterized protein n=1 Tax=Araneus ventricosus TaxID=182803 RepID=A0A4Y2W6S4_ARAVE|nr:hypothetical protein AVEN_203734-1 [Araneus ventricosus]
MNIISAIQQECVKDASFRDVSLTRHKSAKRKTRTIAELFPSNVQLYIDLQQQRFFPQDERDRTDVAVNTGTLCLSSAGATGLMLLEVRARTIWTAQYKTIQPTPADQFQAKQEELTSAHRLSIAPYGQGKFPAVKTNRGGQIVKSF